MRKSIFKPHKFSGIGISLFLLILILTTCSSGGGNSKGNSTATKTSNNSGTTNPSVDVTTDAVTPAPQVKLGSQLCPATVSSPAHWDTIIPTQQGVNSVKSVTCANLVGNPTLQALVTVLSNGSGNYLDVYVYNNITSPSPTKTFQLLRLAQGNAKLGGYNTILTAEVDQNSSVNKNAGGANAQQPDLFREFKWSDAAGTFVPIPFPGLFPV